MNARVKRAVAAARRVQRQRTGNHGGLEQALGQGLADQAEEGGEAVFLLEQVEHRAGDALDAVGRRWRVAYTSTSLAGSQSAVNAGLGVTVLPRAMVPPYLTAIGVESQLPPLYDTEMALIEAAGLSETAHRLAQHIVAALERGNTTAAGT